MAEGKVRWAVLGAAKIATTKVIPAMQKGDWSAVIGIASRDLDKARRVAKQFRHSQGLRVIRGGTG